MTISAASGKTDDLLLTDTTKRDADIDRKLYQALILGATDAFLAMNDKGQIIDWSPLAEEMFGWSFTEILGQPALTTIVPPALARKYRKAYSHLWSRNSADKPGVKRRLTLQDRWGDTLSAEIQISPVKIEEHWYFPCLVRDISDTLLAEQQLIQAQKLEAIGHLTGGLAHDFNNILSIIIGSLDLITPTSNPTEAKELLDAALAAAHRGADITRTLLAVARRRALNPEPTDVNQLIDEIIPLLRQSAGKKLEIEFSNNAVDAICEIDPGGLANALMNLVINARDAMPKGGRVLVYTYRTEVLPRSLMVPLELKPGPYLVIGVDDSGCGMSDEVALRAFDPFFTTKGRGQGTGLGLAMVYGFARQSGGTARIQSAIGRGASVQLMLPASATPR
jgi:PAS domain S-box-containing protein